MGIPAKRIYVHGSNNDLGSSVEDVWTGGGLYTWLTSAVTLEAISDSADDTSGGSGARTIRVFGLDANMDEISEDITMNGLSATSATSSSFLRINRVDLIETGTYATTTQAGGSAGDITIRTSSAGATHAQILRTAADTTVWNFGESQVARYSVPAGFSCLVHSVHVSCEAAKAADVILWQRPGADTTSAPFTAKRMLMAFDGVQGSVDRPLLNPLRVPPKTDIWWSARLTTGANGKIDVDMELTLEDEG